MSETADIAIIGAGIVGAACAERLSREGLNVVIFESAVIGGGATAAGMGHIVVMDDSEAEFALTRLSRELWDDLRADLPPEVEFERCGTLWVAADEEELAAVRKKAGFYAARGVRAEQLDTSALANAEPNLRPGLAGGLLVPDDSVIYAPCTARWLIERARERGASVRTGVRVVELQPHALVLSNGSRLSFGRAVCATGTWAAEFFPELRIRPRKGHLAITDRYPGFIRHQLVELGYLKSAHGSAAESVAFNVQPRATGQVLIGSSRQFGPQDPLVEAHMLSRMLSRAIEYMPAIGRLSVIRTWTGFRAATEDKLPFIGPHPEKPNFYLATGHEGLGITTSLGTAQLIADLMLGRNPAIGPEPYLPRRILQQPAHA
jgi:glycine/D-amino acid oxidase-like deaminating enzyme